MALEHAITAKWPAQNPDVIQLYSLPTPNGIKASAMLEESGLEYEPHTVNFREGEQKSEAFLALNPNGKIPAIIDPNGPGGEPLALFESGAILIYLADKSGRLIPSDPAGRYAALQWVMWQMGGPGPMFGQFGFFHKFAGKAYEDRRPFERYRDETTRLLGVLEKRLEARAYILGADYSIADLALWPWVRNLGGFYEGAEVLELHKYERMNDWLARCANRPASLAAINIPPRPD